MRERTPAARAASRSAGSRPRSTRRPRELRLRRTLEQLLEEQPHVSLVSVGVDLGVRSDRYTPRPGVPFPELPDAIAQFDLALAPIADVSFNRVRSNIKVKEYAAGGVPWLASPIGPYKGLGEEQGGRLVPDYGWARGADRARRPTRGARRAGRARGGVGPHADRRANVGEWEAVFAEAAERAGRAVGVSLARSRRRGRAPAGAGAGGARARTIVPRPIAAPEPPPAPPTARARSRAAACSGAAPRADAQPPPRAARAYTGGSPCRPSAATTASSRTARSARATRWRSSPRAARAPRSRPAAPRARAQRVDRARRSRRRRRARASGRARAGGRLPLAAGPRRQGERGGRAARARRSRSPRARLALLADDPPGLYGEVARAATDREEALWLAFLIAYLGPLDGEDPFAGVRAARTSWASGELPQLDDVAARPAHGARPRARRRDARGLPRVGRARRLAGRRVRGRGGVDARAPLRARVRAARAAGPAPRRALRPARDARRSSALHDMRAGTLQLGGADETTVAAKRVFGIADTLLLERRASELAAAGELPLAALDLGAVELEPPAAPRLRRRARARDARRRRRRAGRRRVRARRRRARSLSAAPLAQSPLQRGIVARYIC